MDHDPSGVGQAADSGATKRLLCHVPCSPQWRHLGWAMLRQLFLLWKQATPVVCRGGASSRVLLQTTYSVFSLLLF